VKGFSHSENFSLSNVTSNAIINLELRKIHKINYRRKQASFRKLQNMGPGGGGRKANSNKLLNKTNESIEILNMFLIINVTVI